VSSLSRNRPKIARAKRGEGKQQATTHQPANPLRRGEHIRRDPERIFAASGRPAPNPSPPSIARVISSRPGWMGAHAAPVNPPTIVPARPCSRHPSSSGAPSLFLPVCSRVCPSLVRRGAINKTFVTRRLWLTGT